MKLLSALIGNRDFKAFAASIMDGSTNSLDDVSGGSSAEFPCDRAASPMEVRLQAQEDEITLLKSSLADALRRLRLHDQQMLLLKQHLIAVNPGAARSLSQLCCADGLSRSCRHSSSSQDGLSPLTNSTGEENGHSHGHHGPSAANLPKQRPTPPACQDRATQTELTLQGMGPGQERVPLALTRAVQSLSLEDALLEGGGLSVAQETLSTLEEGELEEEEEDEDDEQDGGRMKDSTWAPGVEDAIQPTRLVRSGRGVGAEAQDHNGGSSEDQGGSSPSSAPHTPSSGSPAPPKEQCHSPLPPIMEDGKKTLVRRNSERQMRETPDRTKQRLGKKAASSANLLARSPSLESRTKDLISTPGSQGSSRGRTTQGQSIKMFLRGRPITMYIPSNIQNYEDLKMDLPPEKLELDWVYGYRGRDCRANLYLLPSGEAVYFIACVVVLYHLSQRTQRHYRKHTDCVRCLAIHPDKIRVASGQTAGVDKDGKPLQPFVNIWDSTTLTTLQTIGLGTLERGVSSVAFSQSDSGASLCVVDESNEHMLSVWDWAKGVKHAEVKSTNEAVLAVEFNPSDSNNIITSGKSHVHFWMLSSGAFTKKQGIFGKYKKPKFILCFVFSLTGDVLTGDSEGNILTWGKSRADTKTLGKGAKETFQIMRQTRAHEGSVFTLYVLQGGALLSGGGKDRKIIRWSADLAPERECEIPEQYGAVRTIADVDGEELLVGTTRNAILRGTFSDGFTAIVQGHVDEMWGLATHPSQNIFLTCGNDKQLCLWSAEEHSLDWSTTLEESGLCADFCPSGTVVSVGLNTGRWLVLDLRTREVVSDLTDGNEQHSVMRYSPDGSYLAVGSHDNFIYIYSVSESGRRYTRFGKCTGHSSFITHLDWSKDGKYIMSNSGDYEILYWDVAGGCKLLRNRYESKDREWASYTCVLGFHVMGVWLEGSDGTDINALCRSHNERLVAMADDFCKVHLFQYPCPKPKAPSHKYEGHGSHVTNVCFTSSDSHLLSLGGKDTCILQWRVTGGPGPGPSGGHREQRQAQQTPPPAFAASAPASASASASSTSTNSPEPGM